MRRFSAAAVIALCIASSALAALVALAVASSGHGSPTDVPSLVGLSVEQARKLTDAASLLLVFDSERVPDSDQIPPGTVIEQRPLGGSRLHSGESVHATLSIAPQKTHVPVLMDSSLEAAKKSLEEAGLRLGKVQEATSPTVAAGQVIESRPPAGAEVRKGETVHLTVSKGGELVVPNLRGMSAGGARATLDRAGLQLGSTRVAVDDNAADGVVLRQSPPAGTQVQRGAKVDIVVNSS